MYETPWMRNRDEWVRTASDEQLRDVIAAVSAKAHLDGNGGDRGERSDTLLWLATRGTEGREWGSAAEAAATVGGYCGAITDVNHIVAAQEAMGWTVRGDLQRAREQLANLPKEKLAEVSAAATALSSLADEVAAEQK